MSAKLSQVRYNDGILTCPDIILAGRAEGGHLLYAKESRIVDMHPSKSSLTITPFFEQPPLKYLALMISLSLDSTRGIGLQPIIEISWRVQTAKAR